MTDYIDRQAAICAIEEYADRLQMVNWKENPGVPYKAHALNWVINTLRDLPSAEVEPVKRGRWIYDNQFHWYRASCSKCGYKRVTDIKAEKWNDWHYCPHCGAKMEPFSASSENGQEVDE